MDRIFGTLKSPINIVLMALAIGINIAVGQLVAILRLPLYLDSIGTVLVGALLGPVAGGLTGLLANVIWGLLGNVNAIPFAVVAMVIGIMAGIFGRRGVFTNSSPKWVGAVVGGLFFFSLTLFVLTFMNINKDGSMPAMLGIINRHLVVFLVATVVGVVVGALVIKNGGYAGLVGVVTGVVAAIVSAPISEFFFEGVTGSGTDILVAGFLASGQSISNSILGAGGVSDPFDKMASYMVVWAIVSMLPKRLLERFSDQ